MNKSFFSFFLEFKYVIRNEKRGRTRERESKRRGSLSEVPLLSFAFLRRKEAGEILKEDLTNSPHHIMPQAPHAQRSIQIGCW